MTPNKILEHLYTYLPRHTDLFHTKINNIESVKSVSDTGDITSNVIEVTKKYPHCFNVGDVIGMKDAKVATPIISFTQNIDTIEVVVNSIHDLTEGYQNTISLGGFTDNSYNTDYTLSEVISSTTFDINIPDDMPNLEVTGTLTPDITGSFYEDGLYANKKSYRNSDSSYFIWWNVSTDSFTISSVKGDVTGSVWVGNSIITGNYTDFNEAEGTASVAIPSVSLNDSEYMLSERELLEGVFNITEVPDTNTFRFEVPDIVPAQDVYNASLYGNMRIFFALDTSSILRPYTKQNTAASPPVSLDGPFIAVVMGDEVASKDPRLNSSAINQARNISYAKQLYTQNFFVVVILDSVESQTGITPQETIYSEVRHALRKTFHNYSFSADNTVSVVYNTTEISNGKILYNSAVYAHAFEYQIPYEITFKQGFQEAKTVALNNIVGDLYIHPKNLDENIKEEDNKIEIDANF